MKDAKITLSEALIKELDGRKNRWLMEKSGVHESEISKMVTGRLIPTKSQLEKIKAVFPSLNFEL